MSIEGELAEERRALPEVGGTSEALLPRWVAPASTC